MEQQNHAIGYQENGNSFFRLQHNSTACFAVAVLLFFLPFVEYRCGNTPLMGNSGIGIAAGRPWKFTSTWSTNEMMKGVTTDKEALREMTKDTPNIFAIVALLAGLAGAGAAFLKSSWKNIAGMCAGILAAAMMIAVMIQFRMQLGSEIAKNGDKAGGLDIGMSKILKVSFTLWFWLSLVLFAAAAFLNFMRDRIVLGDMIRNTPDFEFQQKKQD